MPPASLMATGEHAHILESTHCEYVLSGGMGSFGLCHFALGQAVLCFIICRRNITAAQGPVGETEPLLCSQWNSNRFNGHFRLLSIRHILCYRMLILANVPI
jgi:hypothetical protein